MKFLFALAALAVISGALALTDEQKEKLKEHYSVCTESSGVDKELAKKAKQGDVSLNDAKLNEFVFCVFKRIGVFGEDGSIHRDVGVNKVEEENKEKVGKAIDACSGSTGADNAEKAWNFWKCYREQRPGVEVL